MPLHHNTGILVREGHATEYRQTGACSLQDALVRDLLSRTRVEARAQLKLNGRAYLSSVLQGLGRTWPDAARQAPPIAWAF